MNEQRQRAAADFRRVMKLVVVLAALMVVVGLVYASQFGELTVHIVVATVLGIFLSVVLGAGLFALAFFSDKSGHDDDVTNATRPRDGGQAGPRDATGQTGRGSRPGA